MGTPLGPDDDDFFAERPDEGIIPSIPVPKKKPKEKAPRTPRPPKAPPPPRVIPTDWTAALLERETKMGFFTRPIAANVATILVRDSRWEGILAYDEFADTIIARQPPPWRESDLPSGGAKPGDWNESDTAKLKMWLSTEYDIDVPNGEVLDGVLVASHRTRIHPVRDWLRSLVWDNKPRVGRWLVDIMGCKDSPYVRAVGAAWAVSAIARIMRPGCKVDTVLVLEGKPGIRKSSVLRAIVGDDWFLEMSITDVSNKDALQVLRRKWIGEFPEIDGLSRHEQSTVKSYFSRQVDTYRKSYGKTSGDFPRQIVFAATTNKSEWITDETGGTGRRMWPVWCTHGDVSAAAVIREQFWAEAMARYLAGEQWHIMDPELIDASLSEQAARLRQDPWEEPISVWLSAPSDLGIRALTGVTTKEVLCGPLNLEVAKHNAADAARVGAILRKLDWVPGKQETRNGARVRIYRPIVEQSDAAERDDDLDAADRALFLRLRGREEERPVSALSEPLLGGGEVD